MARSALFCMLFALLSAFSVQTSRVGSDCTPSELAYDNVRKLAIANNELAINLHKSLAAGSSENVFFSPLSISTAFGMLYYGARGDTAEELRYALGYNKADMPDELVHSTYKYFLKEILNYGYSNDGYVLNTANSVILDEHLELATDYKSDVEDYYQATVQEVDFAQHSALVVSKINSWVREKTNGKIDHLLDELDPTASLVLLNAVYFKGTWRVKFDERKTMPEMFYNHGLESAATKIPMMHMKAHFRHTHMFDCHALELPYKGSNVSMLILLPDQKDGLADFEENLSLEKLSAIQDNLHHAKVIITLPKFKVEYSKELSDDFKKMGAYKIFDTSSADFSGLTTSSYPVAVTQVLHKAVLEVNEEGSEAAAVTGIVSNRMRPIFDHTHVFKADHPFLFAIVENVSGALLFMGRVYEM